MIIILSKKGDKFLDARNKDFKPFKDSVDRPYSYVRKYVSDAAIRKILKPRFTNSNPFPHGY